MTQSSNCNQDLDPLGTSKWPSEPQFCERYTHTYGRKTAKNCHTKVIYKGTFISKQALCTLKNMNWILHNNRSDYASCGIYWSLCWTPQNWNLKKDYFSNFYECSQLQVITLAGIFNFCSKSNCCIVNKIRPSFNGTVNNFPIIFQFSNTTFNHFDFRFSYFLASK